MKIKSIRKKSSVFSLRSWGCRLRSSLGFTLLELLIVISVIMVLAGLLLSAFFKVKNAAKDKQVQIERKVIEAAIQAYKMQERKMPAEDVDLRSGVDKTYGDDDDNNPVMRFLTNSIPPVLDTNKLRWDEHGNVLNPDGEKYKITLDLNNDNSGTNVE